MKRCDTCKLRYEIQRWDYSHGGCEHTKQEGHVCMAFKDEGIAVWMVGNGHVRGVYAWGTARKCRNTAYRNNNEVQVAVG